MKTTYSISVSANGNLYVRCATEAFKTIPGTKIKIEDKSASKAGFVKVETDADANELVKAFESGLLVPRFSKSANEQGNYEVTPVLAGEPVTADEAEETLEHE